MSGRVAQGAALVYTVCKVFAAPNSVGLARSRSLGVGGHLHIWLVWFGVGRLLLSYLLRANFVEFGPKFIKFAYKISVFRVWRARASLSSAKTFFSSS